VGTTERAPSISIRRAKPSDAKTITRIDFKRTGIAKPTHWRDRLAECRSKNGVALVAEQDGKVAGYILGQVRAWEFGSPPTGWVYAVAVAPDVQGKAIGRRLAEAAVERFASAGVVSIRTMVQRESIALLRFFRSLGFRAGPFVELEMQL